MFLLLKLWYFAFCFPVIVPLHVSLNLDVILFMLSSVVDKIIIIIVIIISIIIIVIIINYYVIIIIIIVIINIIIIIIILLRLDCYSSNNDFSSIDNVYRQCVRSR